MNILLAERLPAELLAGKVPEMRSVGARDLYDIEKYSEHDSVRSPWLADLDP